MDINTQKVLVKAITDAQTKKVTPYTTTATVHNILGDTIYVKIQGSDILTPVKSSTVSVNKGDMVDLSVSHTDTHITGNRSDVATNKTVTNEIAGQYASEVLEIVAAKYISTENLYAINAEIKKLKAGTIEVEELIANKATIEQLEVVNQRVGSLENSSATVDNLNEVKARVEALEAGTVTTDDLTTKYLTAEDIKTTYITAEDVATKYAAIDLANVTNAWIINGNIKEGAIGETEIADASITTAKIKDLSADVIKTGTLKTECLILTTDEIDSETGEKKVALITALNAKVNAGEDNVLDGAIIADNTIEASKITVVDLKAFGTTIGNFNIDTSSMYNGKTSLNDPTNGVYIGTDGIALGQGSLLDMTDDSPFRVESDGGFHLGGKDSNYINFDVFTGELDINAKTIKMGSSNVASTSYVDQKASEITSTVEDIDGRITSMEQNSNRRLRVLWSGSYYMKEDQSITLEDAISNQLTGVILAWSAYADGAAGDYDWNYIFVPKEHALRHSGSGVAMTLISSTGWTRASKYVYISDTTISGHSNNNKESTEENGWIVNPSGFVLRYVYGV